MAAQTRIMQQPDTLKDLLELLKDKGAVARVGEVHDEIRKQNALTDEEALKVAEARDFITQHTSLLKDIKAREDKLAVDTETLEKKMADFALASKNESERLASLAKATEDKAAAQAETEKRHLEEHKDIVAARKAHKGEYEQMLDKLRQKANADDKLRETNVAEAARLAAYKQKLEAKAAAYKQAEAI